MQSSLRPLSESDKFKLRLTFRHQYSTGGACAKIVSNPACTVQAGMLRRTFFAVTFLTSIICGATALPAQDNPGSETVLSQCWQFPVDGIMGLESDGRQVFAT